MQVNNIDVVLCRDGLVTAANFISPWPTVPVNGVQIDTQGV